MSPHPAPKPITVKVEPTVIINTPKAELGLLVEAGEQPKSTLLLADARMVPFTTIKLTAQGKDITVKSLTVERKGFGSDRIFTEAGVMDHDFERTLNGNHQYVMREPFTIAAGASEDITLFGNITDIDTLASYDGEMPALALVNIATADNDKIFGTLPIVGTAHTVNDSLVIGSLTMSTSSLDPATNRKLQINDTKQIFSAVRVTASGAEIVALQSIGFTQKGSAGINDIANVKICVSMKNIKCYDATTDDGKWYGGDFGNDITLDKGGFADIYIQGDITTSGANRTVNFDVETSYDITGYGLTYKNFMHSFADASAGDGAQPEGSFSTSEYPFYNGYAHTIQGGSAVYIGR